MVRNLNISRNLGYAHVEDDLLIQPRDLDATLPRRRRHPLHGQPGRAAVGADPDGAGRTPVGAHPSHRHGDHVLRGRARQRGERAPDREPAVADRRDRADRAERLRPRLRPRLGRRAARAAGGRAPARRSCRSTASTGCCAPTARSPSGPACRAHAVRIADNGTVLELDGDGLDGRRARSRPGITLVDGFSVGELRDEVLRDRRRLATDGVLIVVATIAADTAEVVADPEVIVRGFEAPDGDGEQLLDADPRRRGRRARRLPGEGHHGGAAGAGAAARRPRRRDRRS